MNLFSKLFGTETVECPRCLGKGHVDQSDIERLKGELYWTPGKCAYCNGVRNVPAKMVSKVRVDSFYLTTDLSQEERKRFISGDPGALYRAEKKEAEVAHFIMQVEYLHFVGTMEINKIVDFDLMHRLKADTLEEEKQELKVYIEKVIAKKK